MFPIIISFVALLAIIDGVSSQVATVPLGACSSICVQNTASATFASVAVNGSIGLLPQCVIAGTYTQTNGALNSTSSGCASDIVTAGTYGTSLTATSLTSSDLSGLTLQSGIYNSTLGSFGINTSGANITLDGAGDYSSVFIFVMESTLTTIASTSVVLTNGALPENVFWLVGSDATFGATASFCGIVIAQAGITTGATFTHTGSLLSVSSLTFGATNYVYGGANTTTKSATTRASRGAPV